MFWSFIGLVPPASNVPWKYDAHKIVMFMEYILYFLIILLLGVALTGALWMFRVYFIENFRFIIIISNGFLFRNRLDANISLYKMYEVFLFGVF